jgi:nucleotide-binding universal stress UspA family protein
VDALGSILVLADRASEAQAAVRKASVMARHFKASIELFACDTDHAWAIDDPSPTARAAVSTCLAGTERYLDALRGSVAGNDLQITTRAACANSMEEGINSRIRALHPDLVIKTLMAVSDTTPMPPRAREMQLMRGCAVPLLVTRGRSWRPSTKFAAAIELDDHDPKLIASLIESVQFLAQGCGGEHLLVPGRSVDEVQNFVERNQVDVLVIGGPRAGSWRGPEPSTTERLLSVVECDVLIVPCSVTPSKTVVSLS